MPTNPPERRSSEDWAEEKAEEIYQSSCTVTMEIKDQIRKSLLAAEKGGIEKGRNEVLSESTWPDTRYKEGFRKGLERAAGIARIKNDIEGCICDRCSLSRRIRALPIEEPKCE